MNPPLTSPHVSGLDIGWRTRQAAAKAAGKPLEHKRFFNGVRVSYLSDLLCEQGRFGRKTGQWSDIVTKRIYI